MESSPLYKDPRQPLERRVDDLLTRMTLAEKVGQMMQVDGRTDPLGQIRRLQPGSILHILNDELAEAMDAAAATRLGIPLLVGEDGIHGHSFHPGATIFPTQLAMASSWNVELLEAAARVTAREMSTTGAHWTFSPVLCLTRDLRWGRVGETFGEDPYLIGELGVAMIRGYQGGGLDDARGVLACAKHYASYSETIGGRDASEAESSRRKMRAYFLPPFERAARAGCLSFMTGYQATDGLPSTANHWLLRQVLKEEWGFEGILVTDWDNVGRLYHQQKIVPSIKEAAVVAIRCGNDLAMVTPSFFEGAQAAVQEGLLAEAEIDDVVRRILRLKFRMGLFENPRRPDRAAQAQVIASPESRALNLEVARASLVLLENDGFLPLAAERLERVVVLGPNADNPIAQLGDWSLGASQYPKEKGSHPRACTETILDGIRARLPHARVDYAQGCSVLDDDTSGIAAAVELSRGADCVVVVVGDDIPLIGEMNSTATLELQGGQKQLLDAVAAAGVPFVLALVCSKPQVLPPSAERARAVVCCFNPGMRGGLAFAELLVGDINPQGKLTISFPFHVGQQPVFYSQIPAQHGTKYADFTQEPRYRFGHGLSFTRFAYENLRVATPRLSEGERVELSVDVRNTGERDGVEIVQVYLNDVVASVTWPDKKLVDFARVLLRAGEQKTVHFSIPYERLALVDAYERVVVEPGEFEVRVGPSSSERDLLRARFQVEGDAFSFSRIPGVAR